MIQLSKETNEALNKLRLLRALIVTRQATEEEREEYKNTRKDICSDFASLIDKLCSAGLITVRCTDPTYMLPHVREIYYDVDRVCNLETVEEDRAILLHSDTCVEMVPYKRHISDEEFDSGDFDGCDCDCGCDLD